MVPFDKNYDENIATVTYKHHVHMSVWKNVADIYIHHRYMSVWKKNLLAQHATNMYLKIVFEEREESWLLE